MRLTTPPQSAASLGNEVPNVDAIYVDRGRSLLLDLRTQDVFNQSDSTPLPSLISADIALSSAFRRSSQQLLLSSFTNSTQHKPKPARKLSDSFSGQVGRPSRQLNRTSLSVDGGEASDSEEEVDSGLMMMGGSGKRSYSMLHLTQSFRQRRDSYQQSSLKAFTADITSSKKGIKKPRPPYT